MYTISFAPAAFRLFKKLPKEIQKELVAKTKILHTNPTLGQALKGKYRFLRSLHLNSKGTSYRIIYQVFAEAETVVIRLATARENIYRKLDEMKIKGT